MKKQWLVYYVLVILADLVAVLVFPEKLTLNLFSLLPIVFAGFMLSLLQDPLNGEWRRRRGYSASKGNMLMHMKYQREKSMDAMFRKGVEDWREYQQTQQAQYAPYNAVLKSLVYILFPCFLPFVLFFSALTKCLSFLLLLVALLAYGVMGIMIQMQLNREVRNAREQEQKELEEQRKREELGKWK